MLKLFTLTSLFHLSEVNFTFADPVYNGVISQSNPIASEGVEITKIDWYENTSKVNDTAQFKSEKNYIALIYFKAAEGYTIPHNFNDINSVDENLVVRGNGNSLEWMKNSEEGEPFEVVTAHYLGYVVDTNVTHVAINDIDTPLTGQTPDYDAKAQNGVKIDSVRWYKPNGTLMGDNEKFEAGNKYTVEVDISPKTGYTFNITHATIDGNVATKSGTAPVTLKLTFDACKGSVNSVNINVTAPAVGAKPSYDPTENENGYSINKVSYNHNYEKNGTWWYDVTNGKNMLIGGADSAFKDSGVYKVRIALTPDDGFSFAPNVSAKVNGKDAFVETLDNEMINIHYYFSPLVADAPCKNGHTFTNYVYNKDATMEKDGTKTAKCNKCAATNTITATGTKWKNPFADVKTTAYYYDAVLWAVKNNITAGMSATSFAPSSPCTRGQIVSFLYRCLG